jgi:hypothetical protein
VKPAQLFGRFRGHVAPFYDQAATPAENQPAVPTIVPMLLRTSASPANLPAATFPLATLPGAPPPLPLPTTV